MVVAVGRAVGPRVRWSVGPGYSVRPWLTQIVHGASRCVNSLSQVLSQPVTPAPRRTGAPMALAAFPALVERQLNGRSVRQICREAQIPHHWIAYYMRHDTELREMPGDERIDGIGRALGVSSAEARATFRRDLPREEPEPVRMVREVAELWEGMSEPYRRSWLQMGRSLSHLERSVSHDGTPDLGDGRAAV